MSSHWLSMITLAAALIVGYVLLGNRGGDGMDHSVDQPDFMGYYLKNAIITETSENGEPRLRFAANEVTQDPKTDRVTLAAVRIDYVWSDKEPSNRPVANHWVLNADQAILPPAKKSATLPEANSPLLPSHRIELRGNVEAHSVGAPHTAAINTQALDIDTDRQVAMSKANVAINIDGHAASGGNLSVDMKKNRMNLKDNVRMRVADRRAAKPTSESMAVTLPELFESENLQFEDNVVTLTKVRSKSEPFISADSARATGEDLANNQWTLKGNVRLELPKRGLVTADTAIVDIRSSHVSHARVSGTPVHFEHQRKDSNQIVHGRANAIEYDVASQTVQLTGGAWFSNGQFEFTSDFIEYNLNTEAARATRGSGGPVPRKSDAKPESTESSKSSADNANL